MENNFILKIREFYVNNIVALILLPLLSFLFIFISYGNVLHQYLINNIDLYNLYELLTLSKVINSTSFIPVHIVSITLDLVIYSYILFASWLFLFAYSCYFEFSRKKYNFLLILIEFGTLTVIYFFVISPGLSFIVQVLGWLFFSLLIVMFIIYAMFFKLVKHEKE
jgi:hypothetical protein